MTRMTYPSLLFGMLISTIYGTLFHLWRGGGLGRLLLYLILGWAGFWVGHSLAAYLGWEFDRIGPLHVGAGTAASFIFLAAGYWLSLVEVERR
jgi:hypothetical protein